MLSSDDDLHDRGSDPTERSFTLDEDTSASNPGRLRLQPWVWLRHYPRWPLLLGGGLAGSAAAGVYLHWSAWIATALFLPVNWFYWRRTREHFTHGCINASVVVGLEPMRIAVTTDLTKGAGHYPVVKVIEKRLSLVAGQQPQLGTRLATVALYSTSFDGLDSDHWEDFDPVPVECATSDVVAQQRTLDSIPEQEFEDLRNGLAQLPDPPPPGLHRLW